MPHLEGRDIVCFANDWSGDPLSKKHVMRRLARRNRVLWINSLGNRSPRASARDLKRIVDKLQRFAGGLYQVEPNIHVLSPLAVPSSAWVAGSLGAERVIYHCVDEYSAFDGAGADIKALEEDLILRSDLVITC